MFDRGTFLRSHFWHTQDFELWEEQNFGKNQHKILDKESFIHLVRAMILGAKVSHIKSWPVESRVAVFRRFSKNFLDRSWRIPSTKWLVWIVSASSEPGLPIRRGLLILAGGDFMSVISSSSESESNRPYLQLQAKILLLLYEQMCWRSKYLGPSGFILPWGEIVQIQAFF